MKGMVANPTPYIVLDGGFLCVAHVTRTPNHSPFVGWFSARIQILHRIFMLLADASNSGTNRLLHSLVFQWGGPRVRDTFESAFEGN